MSHRGKKLVDISFSSSNTVSGASEPSAQLGAAELLAAIPNPIEAEHVGRVLFKDVSESEFEAALEGITDLEADCAEIRFVELLGDQITIVDMASQLHEGVAGTFILEVARAQFAAQVPEDQELGITNAQSTYTAIHFHR
jgi:hypothetical protein